MGFSFSGSERTSISQPITPPRQFGSRLRAVPTWQIGSEFGDQVHSVYADLRIEVFSEWPGVASTPQHGCEGWAAKVAGVVCCSVGQLTTGARFCECQFRDRPCEVGATERA